MVKNPPANAGDVKRCRFNPCVEKIPWKTAYEIDHCDWSSDVCSSDLKKIRATKGIFHAKMGTIKDRNGMDLTEADRKSVV